MEEREGRIRWAAGFFDGEGTVRIRVSPQPNGSSPRMKLEMAASNTDRRPLDELRDLFGTQHKDFYVYRSPLPNRRPVYRWRVAGDRAYRALREMLPYFRVKGEQAELAVKFFELPWRGRRGFLPGRPQTERASRTANEVATDLDLARQIKALKRA